MDTIEYHSPPDGATIPAPKPEWLRDLVLRAGKEYWNAGAGQAALTWQGGEVRTVLLLTFEETLGFYLEYVDPRSCYYVSVHDDREPRTVTVYVGGNPLLLPSRFFVSRRSAWEAVAHFLRTGEKNDAVRWEERNKQNWDYGTPEPPEGTAFTPGDSSPDSFRFPY
jgi:hypothetical protein